MFERLAPLAAVDFPHALLIGVIVLVAIFALVLVAAAVKYVGLWFQAYMCGADVSLLSLIGMSFRQVQPSLIVTAKIMSARICCN